MSTPLRFVLSQFDTTIQLGRNAIIDFPEEIPPIDTSAVAVIYVNPKAFYETFYVSRYNNAYNNPKYINRYYTLPFFFNSTTLFGSNNTKGFINAMMDVSSTYTSLSASSIH